MELKAFHSLQGNASVSVKLEFDNQLLGECALLFIQAVEEGVWEGEGYCDKLAEQVVEPATGEGEAGQGRHVKEAEQSP